MKKILATLVALGLVFQTCAFASVADMAVSYDIDTNKVSADAVVGAEANTPVVVTVAEDNGEALSIDNLPEFMYLYKTAAEGVLDIEMTMSDDILSGKYVVSVNAKSGSDSKKVMIVNVSDDSEGGTIDVLAEVNGAADADALDEIISDSTKMIKLGVDPDVMAARAAFTEYAATILVAEKSGDWSVDEFIEAYNKALALSAVKSGKYVDTVMENYASEFGTTYEEYAELTEDEKAYAINNMKDFDFTTVDLPDAYAGIFVLMDYKIADTWGKLRDVVEAKRNADESEFDFRCYDKIETKYHEDVYTLLMDAFIECTTIEELNQKFWDVTSEFYGDDINGDIEDDYESSVPSGSGNWGGGGGGVGSTPSIKNPAIPNTNTKDNLVTVTGPQTDDKTERATPAPTVAPVPTEAPALEPGVFVDTADHWAKDYVKTLSEAGVVSGYGDGRFLPNQNVTRAEYIKMIVSMFEIEGTEASSFADTADHWAKEHIEKAAAAGLVQGDGGNFNPNATITRQDAAVILYRLGITAGDTEISFADEASVADYAKDAVATLASAGIINGSDGNFNPTNAITRAETAAILCRAAEKAIADEEATEAPEEVVEDTTEEVVENKTEEVVEDTTEETVEDKTEEAVEDTTEETAEDKAEETVEDEAEEVVEDTTDKTETVVEDKTEETADEETETE